MPTIPAGPDGSIVPGIVTLAEVKAHLQIDEGNVSHDDELSDFIAAVPPVIARWVGAVVPQTHTEILCGPVLVVAHTPILEVVSASWAGGVLVPGSFDVDPDAGLIRPGTSGLDFLAPVTVVYRSGYAVVPAVVNLAARIIIEHWWRSQRGNGTGGSFRSGDDYADRSAVPGMGFATPRYAVQLLESVRVSTGLA